MGMTEGWDAVAAQLHLLPCRQRLLLPRPPTEPLAGQHRLTRALIRLAPCADEPAIDRNPPQLHPDCHIQSPEITLHREAKVVAELLDRH